MLKKIVSYSVILAIFALAILPQTSSAAALVITNTGNTCSLLTLNFSIGTSDSRSRGQVSILQNFLKKYGFLSKTAPNGYYGVLTRGAVASFQSANGISATGAVGDSTRALINDLLCGKSSSGMSTSTPTASLKANDSSYLIVNAGDRVGYSWTSTNANRFWSTFSTTYSYCGRNGANNGEWYAKSASGNIAADIMPATYQGCRYLVSYYAQNTKTGVIASSTLTLMVNPASVTSTSTASSSPIVIVTPTISTSTASATISSISPTSGPINTEVTITGTNFSLTGNKVRMGGRVAAQNVTSNGSTIVFRIPSESVSNCTGLTCTSDVRTYATGTYDVTVANQTGNESNAKTFTITSLTPATTTASTNTSPTSALTVNGVTNATVKAGANTTYAWNGSNGTQYYSRYTTNKSYCGVNGQLTGSWLANTASGSLSGAMPSTYIGCTYQLDYYALSSSGQVALSTAYLTVTQ